MTEQQFFKDIVQDNFNKLFGMREFKEDFHPEFIGYICERDGGVWISTIRAREIGKGHFSKLIKEFKEKYAWIKIPTPSKMMQERATHLGFIKKKEWFGEPFNEMGTIMFWEKDGT